MLVKVSHPLLNQALQHVAYAVSSKSVNPILSGIKLQASREGITLTACSGDFQLQYEIAPEEAQAIVHQAGIIVIPARYFIDIVRHLPAGLVTVEMQKPLRICMYSGPAIYHLSGMEPDEFPHMTDMCQRDTVHFPNKELKKWIKQVSFAVSTSETRPVLTGVACTFEGNRLTLLATDGIRMASRSAAIRNTFTEPSSHVIIPGKQLVAYAKMLPDDESTTSISLTSSSIRFMTNQLSMQVSLIGDPLTVFFNGKYMIDILRSIDCEQVCLRFSGKRKPIIIQPADSLTSLYILTPILSDA